MVATRDDCPALRLHLLIGIISIISPVIGSMRRTAEAGPYEPDHCSAACFRAAALAARW